MIRRLDGWYWSRRMPRRGLGTDTNSHPIFLRLSLGTQDRRAARALALQLDAGLERCLTMTPPVTPAALGLTPIDFARTLRDLVLAEDEERRAGRPADRRGTLPGWDGVDIASDLAEALEDAAEELEAGLPPEEFERAVGVDLPGPLAERLLAATAGIRARPPRRSAMAASQQRSLAAAGRAGALRQNDLDPARDVVGRIEAAHGQVQGLGSDATLRLALRVMAEVALENARRELGQYGPPPAEAVPAPPPAPAMAAEPVTTPTPPEAAPPVPASRAPLASATIETCLSERIAPPRPAPSAGCRIAAAPTCSRAGCWRPSMLRWPR